jgi:hypothetical protein
MYRHGNHGEPGFDGLVQRDEFPSIAEAVVGFQPFESGADADLETASQGEAGLEAAPQLAAERPERPVNVSVRVDKPVIRAAQGAAVVSLSQESQPSGQLDRYPSRSVHRGGQDERGEAERGFAHRILFSRPV